MRSNLESITLLSRKAQTHYLLLHLEGRQSTGLNLLYQAVPQSKHLLPVPPTL